VLLVVPNGNRKIWDFWDGETDDFPFGAGALGGVAKNYPIDKD
jgi:polyhydroxybutyrate depolymerase